MFEIRYKFFWSHTVIFAHINDQRSDQLNSSNKVLSKRVNVENV